MAERQKLKVIEVKPIQEFGKSGKKLIFKANDGQHDLKYVTFRSSLFEYIKVDATFEADVEVTTRDVDGDTYTDRKVNEIYIDGKSVGGESKGEGRRWGRSAEELADIKAQVAIKEVGECWRVDKLSDNDPLVFIYKETLSKWLGLPPAPAKQPKLDTTTQKAGASPSGGTSKSDVDWSHVSKVAALMGLKTTTVLCKALQVNKIPEWSETQELALNKLEEYARLSGYTGAKWQEIKV